MSCFSVVVVAFVFVGVAVARREEWIFVERVETADRFEFVGCGLEIVGIFLRLVSFVVVRVFVSVVVPAIVVRLVSFVLLAAIALLVVVLAVFLLLLCVPD